MDAARPGAPGRDGALTDGDRRLASVGRALDLVEERLRDGIDVGAMASAACYSIFHFVRVFTELTGHGPYDYLMRRRVAEAARELVSGDRSILELALEYRFESPDGFSRAFRRCFGAAPSEARKAGAYAEGSARTPITRERVRASMEAGLTIRAERMPDVLVAGRPLAPGEAAVPGAEFMLLSPGSDAFAGRATDGPADYPLLSARAPGGDFIGVYGDPPLDLGLARDRLYRTAVPVSAARLRIPLELARLDGAGRPAALLVPVAFDGSPFVAGRGAGAMSLKPIGLIHSPYEARGDAPRQGWLSSAESVIELYEAFEEALVGVADAKRLVALYWGDRADRSVLKSPTPFSAEPRGVFTSRSPNRPNPVALCVVDVVSVEGRRIRVRGLDALDGSPVVDLKSYIEEPIRPSGSVLQ